MPKFKESNEAFPHFGDFQTMCTAKNTPFYLGFFPDNVIHPHGILHRWSGIDQCLCLWHHWDTAFHQSPLQTWASQLFVLNISAWTCHCRYQFFVICGLGCGITKFLALVSSHTAVKLNFFSKVGCFIGKILGLRQTKKRGENRGNDRQVIVSESGS